MNRFILISFFLFIICGFCIGQVSVNPSDPFYTDAIRWELLGYTGMLPPQRPYPPVLVKSILKKVIDLGSPEESQKATSYYKKYFDSVIHPVADASGYYTEEFTDSRSMNISGVLGLEGELPVYDALNISYDLKLIGINAITDTFLPVYKGPSFDIVSDPTTLGPLSVYLNMNSVASVGNENIYFQAGVSRTSFGAFPFSSIVFDPQAQHTAYLSFVINREKLIYTQSLFALSATDNLGYRVFPEKFMALHSLDYSLLDNLSLTFYENMLFGGRFCFSYLIPAPFMAVQGIEGFCDNLQMGVGVRYLPVKSLKIVGDLFVDDISANDLVKFNFDTKIKTACQLSAFFSPSESKLKSIYISTTFITPWMYTHSQYFTDETGKEVFGGGDFVNYQNYTNNGKAIATLLPPNSTCVFYSMTLNPTSPLTLNILSSMMCHANVNETIYTEEAIEYLKAKPGEFLTDGSILDYPDYGNGHLNSALHHFAFMEQPTKMYIWQIGLNASYDFDLRKAGLLTLSIGDTFEYIRNWGVQNSIYNGLSLENPTVDDVENAIAQWRNKIVKNLCRNYLTLTVKYRY